MHAQNSVDQVVIRPGNEANMYSAVGHCAPSPPDLLSVEFVLSQLSARCCYVVALMWRTKSHLLPKYARYDWMRLVLVLMWTTKSHLLPKYS